MHHVPTAPHACGASFVPSGRGMIVSMSRAKVSRRSGPGCNMRLYTMAFMGMAPVGSLVAGSMAMQLTAPQMVRIGGLCCLVGALVFARHLPRPAGDDPASLCHQGTPSGHRGTGADRHGSQSPCAPLAISFAVLGNPEPLYLLELLG